MNDLRNIVERTLVPHTAFQKASAQLEQCFSYSNGSAEPICVAVIGESRTGKSRALEECWALHPQVRCADGLLSPILRVKTPSKPTVKGLVELMLGSLKDPLFNKGTEIERTVRLMRLMQNCGVRMVMIDEFQHFYDKGSHKVMHHVADWLKNLVDEAKVALVVAGLPTCGAVLDQNEQLSGRFMAPIDMPRFDWKNDDHRGEFCAILDAFEESVGCYFKLPNLGDAEMAFRCYCGTGGLIGYLTKFLRKAVWNALDAGSTTITLEDLARAHGETIWARDGAVGICSPFSRNFFASPSEDVLATVANIGVAREPVHATKGRRRSIKGESVSQFLSAS